MCGTCFQPVTGVPPANSRCSVAADGSSAELCRPGPIPDEQNRDRQGAASPIPKRQRGLTPGATGGLPTSALPTLSSVSPHPSPPAPDDCVVPPTEPEAPARVYRPAPDNTPAFQRRCGRTRRWRLPTIVSRRQQTPKRQRGLTPPRAFPSESPDPPSPPDRVSHIPAWCCTMSPTHF